MKAIPKIRHFTIGAAIASAILSLPAAAQDMLTFADFDLNKDGKISESEFDEVRAARISQRATAGYPMRGLASAPAFGDIDTNKDGTLSPEEFSVQHAQHQQNRRR